LKGLYRFLWIKQKNMTEKCQSYYIDY